MKKTRKRKTRKIRGSDLINCCACLTLAARKKCKICMGTGYTTVEIIARRLQKAK
jgi:hypothetical protein